MIKIFQYNNANGTVELNLPEILLVKEFSALMRDERNITDQDKTGKFKTRAFREFTYIYLCLDWTSPYSDYAEQDRHEVSLEDAGLTEEEFNDPDFRAACRKFKEIQNSNKSIRLLEAANEMVDKFIDYFKNVDPMERDEMTGKPIYKVKDIQAEMKNLTDVHETMVELENQVKKQLEAKTSMRGNVMEDFDPGDF